jgi:Xaa-Pro aminopeptidase
MNFRILKDEIYIKRRQALKSKVHSGVILLLGNNEAPMNYKDNTYRFRQDSTFLYFLGLDVAGLAAIIDCDSGEEIIFGNELTLDDIVWTGLLPSAKEMAASVGVHKSQAVSTLFDYVSKQQVLKRHIHFLPPYRHDNILFLHQVLNIPVQQIHAQVSLSLIKAIISLRSIKDIHEIQELHQAANITANMHLAAMTAAKPGMKEYEVVAAVHQEAIKGGGDLSFPIILTVNGETLHNHYHGNTIFEGQMILCDAGAETDLHYAGDMTRTFPVGKAFSQKQKEIYQIVLDAHLQAVSMLKPGVFYKDVYIKASEIIFDGLKGLGITKGDPAEAVQAGAHAMFFQCGLGHMMGLDVHDMEDLGEQYVGYDDTIQKSTQFGMKSLRLGKKLEEGFVLTVEPGIYFIPTLIDNWKAEKLFIDFINYDKLEAYKDFSGIRIEEDFVITHDGFKLLGKPLAKSIIEIEEIRRESLGL